MTTSPPSADDANVIGLAGAIAAAIIGGAAIGVAIAALNQHHPDLDKAGRVEVEIPKRFELATASAPKRLSALLRLGPSVTYRAGKDSGDGLMLFGESTADGPKLLPEDVEAIAEPQTIGHFTGVRATGIRDPASGRAVTVYAVPTDAYVAEVICIAPAAGTSKTFDRSCGHAATTLRISKANAIDDAARTRFHRAFDRVVTNYDRSAQTWRAKLRAADSPTDQGDAADQLQKVSGNARTAVGELPPNPYAGAARRALGTALGEEADAFGAMAQAARGKNEQAFDLAASDAHDAHTAVVDSVRRSKREA